MKHYVEQSGDIPERAWSSFHEVTKLIGFLPDHRGKKETRNGPAYINWTCHGIALAYAMWCRSKTDAIKWNVANGYFKMNGYEHSWLYANVWRMPDGEKVARETKLIFDPYPPCCPHPLIFYIGAGSWWHGIYIQNEQQHLERASDYSREANEILRYWRV